MTKSTKLQNDDNHMVEVAKAIKVTRTSGCHADMCAMPRVELINEKELTSLYAMLAYVAYQQKARQETVQMIAEAEFGVDDVSKIRRNDYMRAVEFLVDLKMDEVIN